MSKNEIEAGKRAAMMLMGVNGIGTLCIVANYFGIKPKLAKTVSRYTLSIFMTLAGYAHFDPKLMSFYMNIMPPMLPAKEFLIYLSGMVEIAAGLLSLIPGTRNIGGYLTIATLLGRIQQIYTILILYQFRKNPSIKNNHIHHFTTFQDSIFHPPSKMSTIIALIN